MKHTTKRLTSIFLAHSLLVGMMTLFSTGASAASNLTVQVTSNLPNLFPDTDIEIGAYCLSGCFELTKVHLPDQLTKILLTHNGTMKYRILIIEDECIGMEREELREYGKFIRK